MNKFWYRYGGVRDFLVLGFAGAFEARLLQKSKKKLKN